MFKQISSTDVLRTITSYIDFLDAIANYGNVLNNLKSDFLPTLQLCSEIEIPYLYAMKTNAIEHDVRSVPNQGLFGCRAQGQVSCSNVFGSRTVRVIDFFG